MRFFAVFAHASVAVVGLFAAGASLAATHYPLTLPNCGAPVTVQAAPQRAVSLGQASTEILLSLGLAPRMVGTGV